MKTDYLKFKKILDRTGKTYFELHDLKKFYSGGKGSLKTLLSNWTNRDIIQRIGKGYYAFDIAKVDYLRVANELDKNSYISFEYALYYHNLIDQVPSVITSASKTRSKKVLMSNWSFEYTHLKDTLFFGYVLKDNIYIATPEKAIADLIYLISRGKRIVELDTLEIKKIDQKKLRDILKKFPNYTMLKAKSLNILR